MGYVPREELRFLHLVTMESVTGNCWSCTGLLRKLDPMTRLQSDTNNVETPLRGNMFVPKSRALSYLRVSKRAVYDYDDGWDDGIGGGGERGLACECCVHMCTYDEMVEYCHQPLVRKRLELSASAQTDR